MSSSTARGASAGLLLGAGAGIVLALCDFGALWLWLPFWSERLVLLLRLVASLAAIGAVIGVGAGAVAGAWEVRVEGAGWRGMARRSAPHAVLAAAPLSLVAWLLFTGGKMSRLPFHALLVPLVGVALVAGAWVALTAGIALVRWARAGARWRGIAVGTVLIVSATMAAKLDQRILPNLYEYLHATLTLVAGILVAAGLASGAPHVASLSRLETMSARWLTAVAGALALLLAIHLGTLPRSPNVRVALLDPRASSSRTLMLGLGPIVAAADARPHGRFARQRARDAEQRRRLAGMAGLPETPGAHVLLVTIDALRADHLGAYGYARGVSPNLDALAARSVVFERAYSAAPHSSYSLSSTMASEYLHETLDLDQPLPEETLPRVLAAAGWHTAAFYPLGIFHTEGERLTRYRDEAFGFDVHDHTDLEAEALTDRALAEVDRVVAGGEAPTFFWVHYFDVHEPYEDTSLGTSDVDRYDGELRKADRAVARLLREMDRRLEAPIVVVVTSDHGEEFRDHGGVYHGSTLFEEQIHVPLFVSAPGFAPRRVAAPVQSIDLGPTLAGLVGVDIPREWRGHDLRALMTGRVHDVGPAYAAVLSKRMIVDGHEKLIADLRFGTYELYDLDLDPHERLNLGGGDPATVSRLRDEIYAWLDGLAAPPGGGAQDPRALALDRGRLGDRRAEDDLGRLVLDATAPEDMRREAARILGRLADTRMADVLVTGETDPNRLVAADCAIALGRMYDPRGKELLRELVLYEDPDIRTRAAVSLGRLRDRAAVPALIEALTHAETAYDREEAVRWLGRLRDPRAVEPLLESIPEFRTRYLVVIALGQIGDARAFEPLADMLTWEHRSNIRDNLVEGLGLLHDPRAIPLLVDIAATEPDMRNATESLIRLGALERGAIGGADVIPGAGPGLAHCLAAPLVHDWDYLNRTVCDTTTPRATLHLAVPRSVAHAESVVVILSAKRADATTPVTLHVTLGHAALADARIDGGWTELRWTVPARTLAGPRADAVITSDDPAARLTLDQLVLIPVPPRVAAAP